VSKRAGAGDDPALRLARLPPGRHGLPREFVTQNQRDRLAAGTIAVVAERGLNEATITQICAAAGVSRRTFYSYFSSKEECFFAAYDTIAEHLKIATDLSRAKTTSR
jgi:AcrR family transcriptional regulator